MTPTWTTACPDWERRIVEGRSLIPCGPLFPDEAAAALEVFKSLRVVDVPGAPTVGQIARPWILDFAAAFFGAYDPESGKRLIRTYYLKVCKKNWKSGITAFLMGTLLIRNWRESGEFGIIAPTTEVANNAFGPLKHAIRKDEELSDLLHVQDHIRQITHRNTKATLQIVAAESDTVSGKKFIVTLVEELWQFGKRANADAMLLEATGGMASRDEGAVIYITTESDEQPAGVYAAKNLYARKVRDGEIIDATFLPVLYEWPREMVESQAYLNLENAGIVNPNLGASVSTEWLRAKFSETKAESETAFQAFIAKHLNVEIGIGMRTDRWAGAGFWEVQAVPKFTVADMIRDCEVITAGIDGGGLDDLLGLCLIGRRTSDKKWMCWTHAWAHPIVFKRRQEIAPRLKDFRDDGDVTFVESHGQDVEQVVAILSTVQKAQLLDGIGLDASGVASIKEAIVNAKIPAEKMFAISQGWQMNGAIKSAERKLAAGEMIHGGQRLMNWCVGNAKVVPKGNAIVITKQASGTAKIDPLMAVFDAVTLMSLNPASPKPKYQSFFIGGR